MIIIKRVVCVLVAVLLLLVGCGSKPQKLTMDVFELSDLLANNIVFTDTMSVLEEDIMLDIFGVDKELVKAQKVYVSTGATAEEVAVFQAYDNQGATKIYKILEKRIEDQKLAFENYVPQELAKLSTAVLEQRENYVILCISDYSQNVKDIIASYILK
ncbi:MAG: DUF4358 domain-containing protein [Oscillospiraceae bacterium]|nr:DUF4358 domain-containing protein [Oscillospiraceae bacterium]